MAKGVEGDVLLLIHHTYGDGDTERAQLAKIYSSTFLQSTEDEAREC